MIYTWDCRGKLIEVERKAKDSDVPPTYEEALKYFPELTDKGYIKLEPRKVVTGGSFSKGFGQKGEW